jgi:hypothetical protein
VAEFFEPLPVLLQEQEEEQPFFLLHGIRGAEAEKKEQII